MSRRYGALGADRKRDGHRAKAAVILVVGLLCSTFALAPGARAADTFVVNSTADAPDANPGDSVCATAAAVCTLRAAIQESNLAFPETDTINFDITPNTISPLSELPIITVSVIIDGTSDPDSDRVELDGSAAGAGAAGLRIISGLNTVRGLVVNNFDLGIALIGIDGHGSTIENNWIGTDVTGTVAEPNRIGVVINRSFDNTIRENLISGNTSIGLEISESLRNLVEDNTIGTDFTGTADLGNGGQGVLLGLTDDNTVVGNLISGNDGDGLVISAARGNLVGRNTIGTDRTGSIDLGNAGNGVVIETASDNMVGGIAPGEGNRIAFNSLDGVRVVGAGAVGNSILSNSIESNGELGIDLDPDGPTLNDPGDADTGPNDLQNFPELTDVTLTFVAGTLNSEPNKAYRIEVFESATPDPSGFGEGATFLGAVDVMTDGVGDAAFNLPTAVSPGFFVTATATALSSVGSTSEFSRALQAPGAPPSGADLSITKVDSPDPARVGGTVTYTLTVRNDGPDPATGVVVTDALPAGVDFLSASATQGTCAQTGGTVTCNLGSLAPSATATVTIEVRPTEAGTITDTASVTANETDPDEANNSDTETTTVEPERDYDSDEPDNEFDFDSPFNTDTTGPGDPNGDAAGFGTPTGTSAAAPTGGADPVPDSVTPPLPTVSGTEVLGDGLGWLDDAATAPSPSSALAQGAGGSDVGAGYGELPRTGGGTAPLAAGFLLLATACRAARRRWRA